MLNITDIEKRLRENPEPKEVAEIRENILNSFNRLEFIEEGHKYYLHHDDGTQEELRSVSATCESFAKQEDWDAIADRYALKRNMDVSDVKRMWKENNIRSTNNGTSTHLFGENYMHFFMGHPEKICDVIKPQYEDGYLIPYGGKQEAIVRFFEDLYNVVTIYPVIPETQIYTGLNDTYRLKQNFAGTFDMLFAYRRGNDWKLLIYDYKGLPLDTPIATTEGWKTMGTLTLNDMVYDKEGKPTRIRAISDIHNKPCLRIRFDNGDTITCDCDHRWLIYVGDEGQQRVMTAQEIYDFKHKKDRKDTIPFYVPNVKTVEIEGYSVEERLDRLCELSGLPRILFEKYSDTRHSVRIKDDESKREIIEILSMLGIKTYWNENKRRLEFIYSDRFQYRKIVSIRKTPTVKTKCIEVESPTHTFCCGNIMLVTHNTNRELTSSYNQSHGTCMLPPFNDLIDEAKSHYTLQLSCYEMGLRQLGYDVIDRKLIWLKEDGNYEKITLPSVVDKLKDNL